MEGRKRRRKTRKRRKSRRRKRNRTVPSGRNGTYTLQIKTKDQRGQRTTREPNNLKLKPIRKAIKKMAAPDGRNKRHSGS